MTCRARPRRSGASCARSRSRRCWRASSRSSSAGRAKSRRSVARRPPRASRPRTSTSSSRARRRTRSSSSSPSSGTSAIPRYPDQDTDPNTPGPTRFDGPLHNQIPEPDRTKDNKTIWQADYSRAHYQNLYFGTSKASDSLKRWYERQSSGRYSVDGMVTDWVKVPYNEARYGRSNGFPCAGSICGNSYDLIRDGLNAWVDSQKAQGKTDAQIAATLKSYRRVGPQRLRPRRQLQRAGRLHRPLPDRPRRRRPGRR